VFIRNQKKNTKSSQSWT